MENITRSVYGNALQDMMLMRLPFKLVQNTTLNEKFNIQSGVAPVAGEYPGLGYFAIGNAGHQYQTGTDGIAITKPRQHQPTDAALFHHMPFVLREPELDLTQAQRANYALRRQETINGKSYFAYYLKRFSLDSTVGVKMEYRVVNNGQTVISPFVPDASNLNPTPLELASNGVVKTSGDYVVAHVTFPLTMNEEDAAELRHVAAVMYNDEAFAIMSEIALCTGVDKVVSVNGATGSFNFKEAIAVQVASFIATDTSFVFNSNGVDLTLNVGAADPLFKLVAA